MVTPSNIPDRRALYAALESGEIAPADAVALCRSEERFAGVRTRPLATHLPGCFSRAAGELVASCSLGGKEPVSSLDEQQASALAAAMEGYASEREQRLRARRVSAARAAGRAMLAKGDAMRSAAASVAAGEASLPAALADLAADPYGRRVALGRLLLELPRIGRVKAARIMADAGIPEDALVGEVSVDQARAVELALVRLGVTR